MPIRLRTSDADFAAGFQGFLATKREVSEEVDQAVRTIIADLISNDDAPFTPDDTDSLVMMSKESLERMRETFLAGGKKPRAQADDEFIDVMPVEEQARQNRGVRANAEAEAFFPESTLKKWFVDGP